MSMSGTWLCKYVFFVNKEMDNGNQLDWSLSEVFLCVAKLQIDLKLTTVLPQYPSVVETFELWDTTTFFKYSFNLLYFSFSMYLKKKVLWVFSDFILKIQQCVHGFILPESVIPLFTSFQCFHSCFFSILLLLEWKRIFQNKISPLTLLSDFVQVLWTRQMTAK